MLFSYQPDIVDYQSGNRREVLEQYIRSEEVETGTPANLEAVREWSLKYITYLRGEYRKPMLTLTEGQSLDYTTKAFSARDWQRDLNPDPIRYPELYGLEAQARGLTPEQMAGMILQVEMVMRVTNDQINGVAVAVETAVQAAESIKEIVDILVEADWPVVPDIG